MQKTSMSFRSSFLALENAGDSCWGLASWSWIGYDHWSLIHPWPEFWLSILILKVQRPSIFFKSWIGAFEDAGSSLMGFGTHDYRFLGSREAPSSRFKMLIYQRPVTISKSRLKCWTPVRNTSPHKIPKSGLQGHRWSLHLQNQDREPKFWTWVY